VTRIPREVARRIDRLAARAHRFHRWAHHPLCGAYADEIVRVGKLRVCRGCAYAAIGGAAGGSIALVAPAGMMIAAVVGAGALAILAASIAWRRVRGVRPTKIVTRFAPAAALAFAITRGVLVGGVAIAIAACASAAALALLAAYKRRGNDRAPCATCPERAMSPCSGFRPIVMRERAFQRVSLRLLREAGL
jgi:hypothetical protein